MTEAALNSQPDDEVASTAAGRLSVDGRKALIELLARGSVPLRTKPDLYKSLLAEREVVVSILADLELRADFIKSSGGIVMLMSRNLADADEADDRAALVRRRRLNDFETFAALILRQHFRDRELAGDQRIVIEVEQFADALSPMMPLPDSTTRERRRLSAVIDKFKEFGILVTLRGDDERFEVSPVITAVVQSDVLSTLLDQYKQRLGMDQVGVASVDQDAISNE